MDAFLDHLHEQSSSNTNPETSEQVINEESSILPPSSAPSVRQVSAGKPVAPERNGTNRFKAGRDGKSSGNDWDTFVQRFLQVPSGYIPSDKRIALTKRADHILNLLAREADNLNTHATKQQILDNLLQYVFDHNQELLLHLYQEQKRRTDQETGFEI